MLKKQQESVNNLKEVMLYSLNLLLQSNVLEPLKKFYIYGQIDGEKTEFKQIFSILKPLELCLGFQNMLNL